MSSAGSRVIRVGMEIVTFNAAKAISELKNYENSLTRLDNIGMKTARDLGTSWAQIGAGATQVRTLDTAVKTLNTTFNQSTPIIQRWAANFRTLGPQLSTPLNQARASMQQFSQIFTQASQRLIQDGQRIKASFDQIGATMQVVGQRAVALTSQFRTVEASMRTIGATVKTFNMDIDMMNQKLIMLDQNMQRVVTSTITMANSQRNATTRQRETSMAVEETNVAINNQASGFQNAMTSIVPYISRMMNFGLTLSMAYMAMDEANGMTQALGDSQKKVTVLQERLTQAIEKYGMGSRQAESATRQLEDAMRGLGFMERNAGMAARDVSYFMILLATNIIGTVLPAFSNWNQTMETATKAANKLKGALAGLASVNILSGISGLFPAFGRAAKGADDFGDKLLNLEKNALKGTDGMKTLGASMFGAAAGAGGLRTLIGPLGIALAAVAATVGAYATNFMGARDIMNNFGASVSQAVPILRPFGDALVWLGGVLGITGETAQQTQSHFQDMTNGFAGMSTLWNNTVVNMQNSNNAFISNLGHTVQGIGDQLGIMGGHFTTQVNASVTTWGRLMDAFARDDYREAVNIIGQALADIPGIAAVVLDDINKIAEELWVGLVEQLKLIQPGIAEALKDLGGLVGAAFQHLGEAIYRSLEETGQFIVGFFGEIGSRIGQALGSASHIVTTWLSDNVIKPIQEFPSNIVVGAEKIWSAIIGTSTDILSTVGNWAYNYISVPLMNFYTRIQGVAHLVINNLLSGDWTNTVSTWLGSAADFLETLPAHVVGIGEDIISGLLSGNWAGAIWDWASNAWAELNKAWHNFITGGGKESDVIQKAQGEVSEQYSQMDYVNNKALNYQKLQTTKDRFKKYDSSLTDEEAEIVAKENMKATGQLLPESPEVIELPTVEDVGKEQRLTQSEIDNQKRLREQMLKSKAISMPTTPITSTTTPKTFTPITEPIATQDTGLTTQNVPGDVGVVTSQLASGLDMALGKGMYFGTEDIRNPYEVAAEADALEQQKMLEAQQRGEEYQPDEGIGKRFLESKGLAESYEQYKKIDEDLQNLIGTTTAYNQLLSNTYGQEIIAATGTEKRRNELTMANVALVESRAYNDEYFRQLEDGEVLQTSYNQGIEDQRKALGDLQVSNANLIGSNDELQRQMDNGTMIQARYNQGFYEQERALMEQELALNQAIGAYDKLSEQMLTGLPQMLAFEEGVLAQKNALIEAHLENQKMAGSLSELARQYMDGTQQAVLFNTGVLEQQSSALQAYGAISQLEGSLTEYNKQLANGLPQYTAYKTALLETSRALSDIEVQTGATVGEVKALFEAIKSGSADLQRFNSGFAQGALDIVTWYGEIETSKGHVEGTWAAIKDLGSELNITLPEGFRSSQEDVMDWIGIMEKAPETLGKFSSKVHETGQGILADLGKAFREGGDEFDDAVEDLSERLGFKVSNELKGSLQPQIVAEAFRSPISEGIGLLSKMNPFDSRIHEMIAGISSNVHEAIEESPELKEQGQHILDLLTKIPEATGTERVALFAELQKSIEQFGMVLPGVTTSNDALNASFASGTTNIDNMANAYEQLGSKAAQYFAVIGAQTSGYVQAPSKQLAELEKSGYDNSGGQNLAIKAVEQAEEKEISAGQEDGQLAGLEGQLQTLEAMKIAFDSLNAYAATTFTNISNLSTTAVTIMGEQFTQLTQFMGEFWIGFGELANAGFIALTELSTQAVTIIGEQFNGLTGFIGTVVLGIGTMFNELTVAITQLMTQAVQNAAGSFNSLNTHIAGVMTQINTNIGTVAVNTTRAFNTAGQNAAGVMNNLRGHVATVMGQIGTVVNTVMEGVANAFISAGNAAIQVMSGVDTAARVVAYAVGQIGVLAQASMGAVNDLADALEALPNIERTITYTIVTVGSPPAQEGSPGIMGYQGHQVIVGENGREFVQLSKLAEGGIVIGDVNQQGFVTNGMMRMTIPEDAMMTVVPLEGRNAQQFGNKYPAFKPLQNALKYENGIVTSGNTSIKHGSQGVTITIDGEIIIEDGAIKDFQEAVDDFGDNVNDQNQGGGTGTGNIPGSGGASYIPGAGKPCPACTPNSGGTGGGNVGGGTGGTGGASGQYNYQQNINGVEKYYRYNNGQVDTNMTQEEIDNANIPSQYRTGSGTNTGGGGSTSGGTNTPGTGNGNVGNGNTGTGGGTGTGNGTGTNTGSNFSHIQTSGGSRWYKTDTEKGESEDWRVVPMEDDPSKFKIINSKNNKNVAAGFSSIDEAVRWVEHTEGGDFVYNENGQTIARGNTTGGTGSGNVGGGSTYQRRPDTGPDAFYQNNEQRKYAGTADIGASPAIRNRLARTPGINARNEVELTNGDRYTIEEWNALSDQKRIDLAEEYGFFAIPEGSYIHEDYSITPHYYQRPLNSRSGPNPHDPNATRASGSPTGGTGGGTGTGNVGGGSTGTSPQASNLQLLRIKDTGNEASVSAPTGTTYPKAKSGRAVYEQTGASIWPENWFIERQSDGRYMVVDGDGKKVAVDFETWQDAHDWINYVIAETERKTGEQVGANTLPVYKDTTTGKVYAQTPEGELIEQNASIYDDDYITDPNVTARPIKTSSTGGNTGNGNVNPNGSMTPSEATAAGGTQEGYAKEGGWGANDNPEEWEVTRMKDDPNQWKVVDSRGRNVRTNFVSQEAAQDYIDARKNNGQGVDNSNITPQSQPQPNTGTGNVGPTATGATGGTANTPNQNVTGGSGQPQGQSNTNTGTPSSGGGTSTGNVQQSQVISQNSIVNEGNNSNVDLQSGQNSRLRIQNGQVVEATGIYAGYKIGDPLPGMGGGTGGGSTGSNIDVWTKKPVKNELSALMARMSSNFVIPEMGFDEMATQPSNYDQFIDPLVREFGFNPSEIGSGDGTGGGGSDGGGGSGNNNPWSWMFKIFEKMTGLMDILLGKKFNVQGLWQDASNITAKNIGSYL